MNSKRILFRALAAGINGISYFSPGWAGKLSFQLFCTVPPPVIRPKEADFLATAKRLDRQIDGYTIPVYQFGPDEAPPVFCAYGWAYNSGRWRHFVPGLLAAGYRVITFDPPGHGEASGRQLTFPLMVSIERQLIEQLGACDLVLGHSFGGGTMVETLSLLPPHLRPRRICLMAIPSEVRWLFAGFANFMNFRPVVYQEMQDYIESIAGRSLDGYDVAHFASQLKEIPTLLIHDPEDPVTAYRNARRNHSHWKNAWLYSPIGAGHHLGTAEVTSTVLDWLIDAKVPAPAVRNTGQLNPMPAIADREEMEVKGVTDFFG